MRTSDGIRYAARDVIKCYVKHIQTKVNQIDALYIRSGVDRDFETYEDLFIVVLDYWLCKSTDFKGFDENLVQECAGILDIMVSTSKYERMFRLYPDGIHDTCILIYKRVAKGLIDNANR